MSGPARLERATRDQRDERNAEESEALFAKVEEELKEQATQSALRDELSRLREAAAQRDAEIARLRSEASEQRIALHEQIALAVQLNATVNTLQNELAATKSGLAWYIVDQLRRMAVRFPRLARLARQTLRMLRRFVRLGRFSALRVGEPAARISASETMQAPIWLDTADSSAPAAAVISPAPAQECILLVLHDGSRTGAPILGYNIAKRLSRRHNVVVLFLGGGELVDDYRAICAAVIGPLGVSATNPADVEDIIDDLTRSFRISYAIANSIATRIVLKPLTMAQIPVVALVHEFASFLPSGEMGRALEWATAVAFSAELTAASLRAEYPNIDNRPVHILRQGRTELPPRDTAALLCEQEAIAKVMRPAGAERDFIVLGVGTINIRKGVDVFLAAASAVRRLHPSRKIRFVWIGDPPPASDIDRIYKSFLDEQMVRADLEDTVSFFGDMADLGPAYDSADLFFMSSRLDPLPNVAIEAALRGLPVICFEGATGITEVLEPNATTRSTVVPYLDAQAAAERIVALASDHHAYSEMCEATLRTARAAFDMDRYVSDIEDVARGAMSLMRQRQEDFATISADPLFDAAHSTGGDPAVKTRDDAIRLFLARAAAFGTGHNPSTNFYYRRPCPGFHPQIYEDQNGDRYDRGTVNALAHFIRAGKPDGPWRHEVISPGQNLSASRAAMRIALHGHFYYPELVGDFLRRLSRNETAADLFLTTGKEEDAQALAQATQDYRRGAVTISVVPNRGRDIGAFLTGIGVEICENYEIVGHLHGKRSLFLADRSLSESWREFLWQNLLGDRHAMVDIIMSRFAADETLGLVFPDDPHLADWDLNLEIAKGLHRRLGIEDPLPTFFDFPVGTMFWARGAALKPLFGLALSWDDYPAEPAPIDGTILHAIERLLPIVARDQGYRYATTHIPGITW